MIWLLPSPCSASALHPKADIRCSLTFVLAHTKSRSSGHIAVARLAQGISPKHCSSPARRAEDCWRYISNLHKAFRMVAALKPGLSTAARLAVASAKRCVTPKGDGKCLVITGLGVPPSLISPLVQLPRRTWTITPRRQRQTLSALILCDKAGPHSLPIVSNQKERRHEVRALLQILHKLTLNTSGATKGRSMIEEVRTTSDHCSQNLRRSQTGIIFGLRQSQQ